MESAPTLADTQAQLAQWYAESPVGQALQAQEAAYLKEVLHLGYGQHFLQLGRLGWEDTFWEADGLRRAWIVQTHWPAVTNSCHAIASAAELPFANGSIDVLLLPHSLEFTTDCPALLQEVERVLKPEGQLHLLGFNPWSAFSLCRCLSLRQRRTAPGKGRFFSSGRVLAWLQRLKFEAQMTASFSLSGASGKRCLPAHWFAAGYAIRAVKRIHRPVSVERLVSLQPHLVVPQGMADLTPP